MSDEQVQNDVAKILAFLVEQETIKQVKKHYHDLPVSLDNQANQEIIKSLNDTLLNHKEASFEQVIASLKVYLLRVIRMMYDASKQQQTSTGEQSGTEKQQ